MTVVKPIASAALVLVCVLKSATVAMAGSKPQFITINAPGADTAAQDFNGTNPNAINYAGAITGVYFDAQSVAHGFLRTPEGGIATFDPPGSTGTVPVALNLESDVVGYYVNQSGLFEAFLRRADGSFATWSDPNACNYSGDGPGNNLPFCGGTAAFNIDVFGVVAGAYTDNSANAVHHGLIRIPGGKLQAYEVPGAGNDEGMVAGFYIDAANVSHGFLLLP